MNIRVLPIILLCYLLFSDSAIGQSCECTDCPGIATAFNTTSYEFSLDGAINDDLSAVDQSICQILVQFAPEHIWSIEMSVTSPAGQTIDIIGPSLNQFGFTGPLPWQIQFLPCGEVPDPDNGFSPVWNNNQNWLPGAFYNGSYHPYNGCLEDFNLGTVNGTWTLTVQNNSPVNIANIVNFQVIPCNLDGLECFDCEPNGGELIDVLPQNLCKGDIDLEFELPPFWSDSIPDSTNYAYLYLVSRMDTLIQVDSILDLTSFDQGIYEICGLSYLITDSLRIPDPTEELTMTEFREDLNSIYNLFCAEISDNCIDINIIGHDTTFIEEELCFGQEYVLVDTTIFTSGIYNRIVTSSINCDSIINLNIDFIDPVDTLVNIDICSGQSYLFGGDLLSDSGIYFWDSLSPRGCDSLVELHLNVIIPPTTNIDTVLCVGEEISVGPNTYNMTGDFQILIETNDPCDSLVNLRLQVLDPIVNIDNPLFLNCNSSPLILDASGSSGINLSYQWEDLTNGGLGINSAADLPQVEVILGGNYQLTIVDSMNMRSCSAMATTPVIDDLSPPQIVGFPPTLSCNQQIGAIQTTPISTITNYEWSGPNGFISASPSPIVTAPGAYELIATGSNGCTDTITYQVAADTLAPVFTLSPVDTITCIDNDVLLQANFSNPNYQISWDGPGAITFEGNNFITNVSGEYSLSIRNPDNGCQMDTTFTVEENISFPQYSIVSLPISCNSPLGELSVISPIENTYTWENEGGFLTNDSTFFNNESGPYFLNITSGNGCVVLDTVLIPLDTIAPIASASATLISCNTPLSTLMGMSSDPLVSYIWSNASGVIDVTSQIEVGAIEEYTMEIISANGCSDSVSIFPGVDTISPILIISDVNLDCNNAQQTVIPDFIDPFASIEWSGPNAFQYFTPTPTITEAGTYSVTITGFNGCTNEQQLSATSDISEPDLVLETDSLSCNNLLANLTATSADAVNVLWSGPGGFTSSDFNIEVNTLGTYTASVEGSNGCFSDSTIFVPGDFDGPVLNFSDGILTCTDSIFLLGDSTISEAWTYQWIGPNSFLSQEAYIAVDFPGNYQVFVEGENGCQSIDQVDVGIDTNSVQITIDSDTINCDFSSVNLNPDIIGTFNQLTWTYPDNSTSSLQSINTSQAGNYHIEVFSSNGCSSQTNVEILIDTIAPIVSIDSTSITCQDETPILSANLQAQNPQIIWSGPNGFTSGNSNPEITEPGNYFINIVDENGCSSDADISVEDDRSIPIFSTANDSLSCLEPALNLPLSFVGNYSVLWQGPNSFNNIQPNPNISEAGIYQLNITDNSNGCVASDSIEIFADTIAPNTWIEDFELSCTVAQVELSANDFNANWSFQWNGPSGFNSNDSNPIVGLVGAYELTISESNGCEQVLSTEVTANDSVPQLEFLFDTITCAQPNANIFVSADLVGTTFSWTGPNGFMSNQFSFEVGDGGTYEVEGTAPNGCEVIANLEMVVDTLSPNFMVEDLEIDCNNASSFANPIATEALTYFWNQLGGGSIQADSFLVSDAGLYSIEAFNEAGCSSIVEYNVVADFVLPQVDLVGGELNCQDTSIQLMSLPTTILANQSWSGPNSFSSVVNNPTINDAGIYLFFAEAENGCRDTFDILVSADTLLPMVQVVSDTITCLDSLATIQTIGSSSQWILSWTGPGTFTSDQSSFMTAFSGDYQLNVQGENFCENTFELNVPVDQDVPQVFVPDSLISCAQPTITLIPYTNQPIDSYRWSNTTQEISVGPQLDVTESGQYILNIVSANGCEAQTTFSIAENFVAPSFQMSNDTISCLETNLNLELIPTNYSTIDWSGPNGFISDDLQPQVTIPGIYSFELISEFGCDTIGQIIIEADTLAPIIELNSNVITCLEDSVLINISGDFEEVTWSSTLGSFGNSSMLWVDSAGMYQGIFEAENGCSENYNIEILDDLIPPNIVLNSDTITCSELFANIDISSSNALLSVDWSGPNNFTATNLDTIVNEVGWYLATIVGVNGCEQTDSIFVTEDIDLPMLTIVGDTLDCSGNLADLSISEDSNIASYSWSGPNGFISNDNISQTALEGIYSVEVIGANGCSENYQTEVVAASIPPLLTLDGSTQLDCENTTVELSTTIPNVDFDYEVNWLLENVVIGQDANTMIDEPGLYYLEFLNTNNLCSSLDSIQVEIDTLTPSIDVSTLNGLTITCDITSILLQGFVNGNISDYNLSWVYENDTVGNANNIEVTDPGEFVFNVFSNINNCSASQNIEIEISNEVPSINLEGSELINCYNLIAELNVDFNLNSDFEITWFNNGSMLSNLTNQEQASFDAPGTYLVQINNLLNGCSSNDSLIVLQDIEEPEIDFLQSNELNCFNNSAELSFVNMNSDALSYFWIDGTDTILTNSALDVENLMNLTLAAQFIDNGCSSSSNVQIEVGNLGPLDLEIDIEQPNCPEDLGQAILGNVDGGLTPYMYSFDGAPFQGQTILPLLSPGSYPLSVQDSEGCELEKLIVIEPALPVFLDLGDDQTIGLGDSVLIVPFSPNTINTYNWDTTIDCDNCDRTFVAPFETTEYLLNVIDERGCLAEDRITIFVKQGSVGYFPSAFSPNNDGNNDIYEVFFSPGVLTVDQFTIFSRWGELIYQNNGFNPSDSNVQWDGTFRGKSLNPAVFIYTAEVTLKNGKRQKLSGDITLLK